MKQVLIKKGKVVVEEVPAPIVKDNSLLVQVVYSCISTGTEISGVTSSGQSLLQRALKEPNKVKKALNLAKTQGIPKTISTIKNKSEVSSPTGYSCAGTVIDVGKNIKDIKIGDRVACAGAGYANHAEIVCVPRNLVVKVPENLDLREAASVTLGAIAMQGVRRAAPSLGERLAVIGLGLIGQLTVQILKVAGCRIMGIDLIKSRVELAQSLGMDYGITAEGNNLVSEVLKYTSGFGADATIITAATKSDEPVYQAMKMTRKKGKVVVVGAVGLHLQRSPFYEKEIDFLISCSYGPGRYDKDYEERGIDYPYAYVRWTENRNMQEYLKLLSENKINFKALISKEYSIEEASKAYESLKSESRPLGVLLKYKESPETFSQKLTRKMVIGSRLTSHVSRLTPINVALIGAGNFAKAVHLPNLKKLSNFYNIYAIVSNTGSNAKETAKRFGANYCTTDYQEVLQDKNVDMVLICTRHNLHAKITIDALKAGKHVFVEKPLCLNQSVLNEIIKVYNSTTPILMVGFNRRFSPFAAKVKEILRKRVNPIIVNYRVNAGYIPKDHWVHTEEGGGRIIGEACHMFDLLNFFTESEVEDISAYSVNPTTEQYLRNDNFVANIKYKDGSICTFTYTALGTKGLGKEYIEIFTEGKVLTIDDFKTLRIFGFKTKNMKLKVVQKGHLEELIEFAKCIRGESSLPIPIDQLVSASEISFEVEKKIAHGFIKEE